MYIKDMGHVWNCLGIPYTTNYWQVGDLFEQNSTAKVLWYCQKQELVAFKQDQGMLMLIGPEDIMCHS
jgi:hypothetical protein